ncbi:hypothetical protein GQ457_03G001300 [Hibiscus cannabinus]
MRYVDLQYLPCLLAVGILGRSLRSPANVVSEMGVHDGDKDEAGRWYVRGAAMVCWKMRPWGRNVHLGGQHLDLGLGIDGYLG